MKVMKINKLLVLVLAGIVTDYGAFALTREDVEAVAQVFESTNNIKQIEQLSYPIYTNIWNNLERTDPERARDIHYLMMTNVLNYKAHDIAYWYKSRHSVMSTMLGRVCSMICRKEDIGYVMSCADYFGNELVELNGNFGGKFVYVYNKQVRFSRLYLCGDLKRLTDRFEAQIPSDEVAAFRTNIINRAKLNEEEIKYLWNKDAKGETTK